MSGKEDIRFERLRELKKKIAGTFLVGALAISIPFLVGGITLHKEIRHDYSLTKSMERTKAKVAYDNVAWSNSIAVQQKMLYDHSMWEQSIETQQQMLAEHEALWQQQQATYSSSQPSVSYASSGSGSYGNSGTSWDAVHSCEALREGWAADTGNGYYGGLQFDTQTWDAFGNPIYTEASNAPMSEQIAAANRVPYDAWPHC